MFGGEIHVVLVPSEVVVDGFLLAAARHNVVVDLAPAAVALRGKGGGLQGEGGTNDGWSYYVVGGDEGKRLERRGTDTGDEGWVLLLLY